MEKLTKKQKAFVEEYVIDFNGGRAYQAAFPACKNRTTARSHASRLLTKEHVKSYIIEVQGDLSKLTGVTAARNIIELKKIAYGTAADMRIDWDNLKDWDTLTAAQKAVISEITTTTTNTVFEDKTTVKIKLYDKKAAIELLNKMLGFNKADKVDVQNTNTNLDLSTLDKDDRKELLKIARKKLNYDK